MATESFKPLSCFGPLEMRSKSRGAFGTIAVEEATMYKLDAREIPLPSSASTQVQDAIAAKLALDVDAWKQMVPN